MQWLRTFTEDLRNSLCDRSFYRSLLKRTFGRGVKYLYTLLVLIAFVWIVTACIGLFKLARYTPELVANVTTYARTAYPPELVVTIREGELSTNVEEPFFIDAPVTIPDENADEEMEIKHWIAIDTSASVEDYFRYESLVLVGKTWIVVPDKNNDTLGTIRVLPLESIEEFTLNRAVYDSWLAKIIPFLGILQPLAYGGIVILLLAGPFVLGGFMLLGKLISLLLLSLLGLLIAAILKTGLGYKQVYTLSLYAITWPILYSVIADILSFHIPFAYTAIYLVWMILVLRTVKTASKSAVPRKQRR